MEGRKQEMVDNYLKKQTKHEAAGSCNKNNQSQSQSQEV